MPETHISQAAYIMFGIGGLCAIHTTHAWRTSWYRYWRIRQVDPAQRITIDEALQHEWVREGGVASDKSVLTSAKDALNNLNKV